MAREYFEDDLIAAAELLGAYKGRREMEAILGSEKLPSSESYYFSSDREICEFFKIGETKWRSLKKDPACPSPAKRSGRYKRDLLVAFIDGDDLNS